MTRLDWYLRRANAMTPGELQYRLKQALLRQLARLPLRHVPHPILGLAPASGAPPCSLEGRQATLDKAADLLAGHFPLFGRTVTYSTSINWHLDPFTQREWPRRFSFDLDYRDNSVGDVKHVWEINRHQFMPCLARAFRVSGDDRYRAQFEAILTNWIDQNPPMIGINWASSYEAALRLISWSLAVRQFGSALSEAFQHLLITSCYQQVGFIRSNLSLYSSANNHLLGELAGIMAACDAFPLPGAAVWLTTAWEHFCSEIELQVHTDGVSAEQALYYHGYVLDLALLALSIAHRQNLAVPDAFLRRLARMGGFFLGCYAQGYWWNFGDEDSGQAYLASDLDATPFHRTAWTLSCVFGVSCPLPSSPGTDETFKSLFGDVSWPLYPDMASEVRTRGLFAEGGYYLHHQDDSAWCFDFGPLGFAPLAAHGHADCLSLNIVAGSDRLLIDPGTYTYNGNLAWRQHFKGTSAHNTVVIDEADQSRMEAAFIWADHASARLIRYEQTHRGTLIEAEHDGYLRLPQGVRHRRTILHDPQGLWFVRDAFFGSGEHKFEQVFHLGLEADWYDGAARLKGAGSWQIRPLSKQEGTIIRGQEAPPQGWNSPQFGERVPGPVLVLSSQKSAPCTLLVAIGSSQMIDSPSLQDFLLWMERN